MTEPLPKRGTCEFLLNGINADAYPVAVIYYDVHSNKIRGQIFTGFQTDPNWQISISTRTVLTKNHLIDYKGILLSQIAAPAIAENSASWTYHGSVPGNFQEIATSDFQFLY